MSGAVKSSENKAMIVSKEGKALIAKDEGFREYPYDDPRKFCTVGNGVLLHRSPCTDDEKKSKYEAGALGETFQSKLNEASRYVRHYVRTQTLNQQQFDALASFVYNVGIGQARDTLELIDAGDFQSATQEMSQFVNITVKDKKGKNISRKLDGLVLRRERESEPFKDVVKAATK